MHIPAPSTTEYGMALHADLKLGATKSLLPLDLLTLTPERGGKSNQMRRWAGAVVTLSISALEVEPIINLT